MSGADDWDARLAAARRQPRTVARDVSLVIPTLGRPIIAGCLAAIAGGRQWPAAIIVVDQGPSERIKTLLDDIATLGIGTRHERSASRGRAPGLNAGLRLVATPFAVVTDDDCIPDADWIAGYAAHFAAHPDMVVTGRVLTAGEERIVNVVSDLQPFVQRKPRVTYDRLSGGNCGIPLEVLGSVGLFDEDPCMRYAEDGEWAYRTLRAGVPIAYVPSVVVTHVGWRDAGERLTQYRGYARSHAAFFGKYLRRGDAFIVLRSCVHLARALKRWLGGVLARDDELAANGRAYALQFLPGLLEGLRSGRRPPVL